MKLLTKFFRIVVPSAVIGFLLTIFPLTASAQGEMYTALANSNIRAEPTTQSPVIGGVRLGERIEVTGDAADGTWYQVKLYDDRTGYVYGRLLQPPPEAVNRETPGESEQTAEGRSPSHEHAFVYFITPYDGEIIPGGQVWVRMGLRNMGVAPAGVDRQFTGHHHLLIDTDMPPLGEEIPSDDNHLHFGRGQTEYLLQLSPGEHTLQILLGDHDHRPHDPPVISKRITVTVPES